MPYKDPEKRREYCRRRYQEKKLEIQAYNRKPEILELRAKNQRNYRKRNKRRWLDLIQTRFGKLQCSNCGYNKCFAALDFHHTSGKDNDIGQLFGRPIHKFGSELNNVVLLCRNCHAELHYEQTGDILDKPEE